MSKSCLNPTDPNVVSLVESSRSNFSNFNDSQIRSVANLYFDINNKLPTPQQLVEFYAGLRTETPKEIYNQTEVTDKEDILDLLQSIFFIGLNKATGGKPLTKLSILENQERVLSSIPKLLDKNGLVNIKENYSQYRELLVKSRLKNLNIDLTDVDLDNLEAQASKDNNWDKDSTLTNNYERASDEVIYLFGSLVSTDTIRGIPKPLNFSDSWNKVQNLLAGTSDLDTQIRLLRTSTLPFKEQILSKLGYGNFDQLPESDYQSARTSFMESFAKNGNNLSKTIPGKRTLDSIEESLIQNIQQKWKSNFLSSDYAKIIGTKRVFNNDKFEDLDNAKGEEFLRLLGIEFTKWDSSLEQPASLIKKYFYNQEVKKDNQFSWLDESKAVSSALKDLLRYEASLQKKDKPLGARNADGEYQHSIGLHSYFSKKIGQLKNGIIKAKNQFEALFTEGRAETNLSQGMSGNGDGRSFDKLGKGDIYTTIITDMFSTQPIIHLPRTSDKKSERGIKFNYNKELVGAKSPKEYFDQYMAYTTIGDQLYDRLFKQYKNDFIKPSLKSVGWTAKKYSEPMGFWNELLGLESLQPISLNSFKERINQYIETQLPGLYNELVKNNVIQENKGKLYTTFSTEFMEGFNGDQAQQKSAIENLLRNYIFNSLLYGTEITQFEMGALGIVKPDEYFKRTAGPVAEGRQPRVDQSLVNFLDQQRPDYMSAFPSSAFLRVTITAEEEVKSPNAAEYNKIIGQEGAYDKVNVDDAQGKMLFENYREYKKMLNEWTDRMELGYNLMLKNQLKLPAFDTLYPPIKPVGYSLINVNGVQVPVYIKTAIYPIHRNMVKGTLNESAYDKMIENGVAIQLPKSGIKLAYPSNLKDQFENGEFVFNSESTFDFPTEDFRSQLDINIKEGFKQLMGTQPRKLIFSNLYENGKLISPEFVDWMEIYKETLQGISNIEADKLYEKAGVEMNGDTPTIKNYSKLRDMLREELLNRNLPINTIEAVNELIDEDGNLLSTIDALPSRQKLMNLLNSIVTNKLIKLYTNGSALVQIAQTGWELKPGSTIETPTSIQFISDEAKENYIKNNGLQFLQIDKETGAAEIILPNKFRKFVNKDGKIDERVLVNIGYRIPTQGLNSILHLKVIGFLPVGMDQMVIMPREITTQGGSDFDVDKLNLFVPNTYEINNRVEYVDPTLNPEDVWKQVEDEKLDKKYGEGSSEAVNKLWASLFGTIDEIVEDEVDFKKEKFIREFRLKQLQNKLIEQTLEVLKNPASLKSLLTPNSAADLENLAKKYKKTAAIETSQMFMPKTLADITEQMYASKALVGVFASQITHHVLSQQVGLHFDTGRPFYFKHNTINDKPSLASTTNQQGSLITDRVGNQYVSGAVDAAKNPFLFDLGCTLDTGDMFALFERLGGNIEILVEWIQQPIIQDYLLAMSNNKQLGNSFTKSNSVILENLYKKYGYERGESEYMTEMYNNTQEKQVILSSLQDQRKDFGNWETKLSQLRSARGQGQLEESAFNQLQKFVLDDFLYLKDAASTVRESISTSKFDTSGPGKDVIQSQLLNQNYENFKRKMNIGQGYTLATLKEDKPAPYDRLITDTLLNVFYKKSAKFVLDLYKDLVLLNKNGIIKNVITEFNDPDSAYVTRKLDEESATLLYGSMINYVLQNNTGLNKELFFTKNSVANQILDIQKNVDHPLHNNYLFTNVFNPEIGNATDVPDIISMQNKSIDPKEADFINQAFGQLKEQDRTLYDKLITVNFFQTGIVQSPVSFYSLIPYNDVLPLANNLLNKHSETISSFRDLTDQLMANIGYKLNNIKRINWKAGDEEFASVIKLPNQRTQGKEYIFYVQENKKAKTKKQGMFKRIADETYELIEPKNYKSLFYNFTKDEFIPKQEDNSDIEVQENAILIEDIVELDPNVALVLGGNEELYQKYNLLASDGKIKTVPDNESTKKWLSTLNQSPYYSFRLRKTTGGNKILIFPKQLPTNNWGSLNEATQKNFEELGITPSIFDSLTEDQKNNLKKCHGR